MNNNSDRLDRKSLKQPDSFVKKGRNIIQWIWQDKHRIRYIPVFLIIFILIATYYGISFWQENKIENAWKDYHTATKLPEPQRWEDLKTITARFPKFRPALFAALSLGDHFYSQVEKNLTANSKTSMPHDIKEDLKNARVWYLKAIEFPNLLPTEKQLLFISIGKTFQLDGNLSAAAQEFQKAVELPNAEAKAIALLSLGHLFEIQNDDKKALQYYEKIVLEFSNTEYGKVAKNLVRKLKSSLWKELNTNQKS